MRKKFKILHLEDVAADAELAARELRRNNLHFEQLVIDTEKEYRNALETFKPDIILCDHSLPAFNSREALNIKRIQNLHIPFILVTATMTDEVALSLVKDGADDYVLKDRLVRLPNAVKNALDKYGLERERQVLIDNVKEREAESQAFTQGILNSLSSHIAVVNGEGIIIKVNQSWRAFAENNNALQNFQYNEGADYFKACENSNDPEVWLLLEKVKEVLRGSRENLYMEYPCHAPDRERWFCMRVNLFTNAGLPMLLVEHQYITERKLAEDKLLVTSQALQHTLNDLNKILDSSPDVICSFNEEGKFINASAASFAIWGYKPTELIGRKYIEFVVADDVPSSLECADLVMGGLNVTNFENRYVRKDGTTVPILWSAQWDREERIMHCIAKDATEKKRLDTAFEAERLRFASLFEQAPSCIGIFKGPEHYFEMANPLFLQLTGKKDVIGKRVRTVLPELEGQGVFELLDQVYSTGNLISGKEIPVKIDRHGDGNLIKIYSNFVYQPYTDINGTVVGIFFFSVDVTEQVLSRKRIEENERNYSLLFHQSPLPQYICDKESLRFLEVNAKALNQYGYTREEFLTKTPLDLQIQNEVHVKEKNSNALTKAGSAFNNFVFHKNKKGQKLLVAVKSSSINYYGVPSILTTVSDMTEEVRLQNKIMDLKMGVQKKITQAHIKGQEVERAFIGRELHDNINQQLTTAKLYLDLARDKEDMRLDLVQKCETVVQNTINEIRNLSKSFMIPSQKELSLQDALDELMISYRAFDTIEFHFKSHACLNNIEEEMKLMFYRIVQEQVNNIIKHAACKNVWIEFDYVDDNIYLMIKDDGKGFDVLHKSSGIGLSNIKVRLELYRGALDIVSAPECGCTLNIVVPKSS